MSEYDGFEWYENAPDGVTPQPPSKYARVVKTCRKVDCEVEMSHDHGVCYPFASANGAGGGGGEVGRRP